MSLAVDNTYSNELTLGRVGAFFEYSLAVVFLLIFSSMFFDSLVQRAPSAADSTWARQVFYPVYLLVMILLLRRPMDTGMALLRNLLLFFPIILALLSTFWSLEPDITFRRSIALLMTTAFAIYLASRFDWGGLINLLATAFAIIAISNLIFIFAVPDRGVMQEIYPGAWSGLWTEKNELGMNMAKAAHLFLCAMIFNPKRAWFWGLMLALATLLVLMSTSKTSLIALLLGLGGVAGLYVFRRGPLIGIPLVYFAIAFGGALVLGFEFAPKFMFGLIGKDPSLTGRTDIWEALFTQIKDHPWLGHGYAVFWLDETGPAFWVRQKTEWLVPSAHNGWLETWLSIGLVGVVLFALIYVTTVFAALRGLLRGNAAYWALISTLVFLLFSLSESNILQQNNLGWVVFAATAAKLFGAGPRPKHQSAEAP